jgi:hypothetical protein
VRDGLPYRVIAFSAVAEYRAQFEAVFGQTLEELNAAGGLDWYELWCGFVGRPLFPTQKIDPADARAAVLARVAEHSLRKRDQPGDG